MKISKYRGEVVATLDGRVDRTPDYPRTDKHRDDDWVLASKGTNISVFFDHGDSNDWGRYCWEEATDGDYCWFKGVDTYTLRTPDGEKLTPYENAMNEDYPPIPDGQEWKPDAVDGIEILGVDDQLTIEARRWLLKGEGVYDADGYASDRGFVQVVVKPFADKGADVWFYTNNRPWGSLHVEFGRTGGDILWCPMDGDEEQ